ncbi:MAG: hypothetical protein GF364_03925 [Candidatus Lokiarchaeota archaeon]|nr:hypothetical protein [Candidatus Lokiarchaeota archaeon]
MRLKRRDYHTHNGFYRGSGEVWTIKQGWTQACQQNIEQLGISPKLESKEQDFVPYLRKQLDSINNYKILLGLEIDARDISGDTFLSPKNQALLDYTMIGPHNMPSQSIIWSELDDEDLSEYFTALRNILVNSLEKNDIDIWVHPFLQEIEISCDMHWKYLEPIYLEVLSICERKSIAVEINANYFRKRSPPKAAVHLWKSDNEYYQEKITILTRMFRIALNEFDIQFSFGSDSHDLKKVGDIGECIKFAKTLGIINKNLLNLNKKT